MFARADRYICDPFGLRHLCINNSCGCCCWLHFSGGDGVGGGGVSGSGSNGNGALVTIAVAVAVAVVWWWCDLNCCVTLQCYTYLWTYWGTESANPALLGVSYVLERESRRIWVFNDWFLCFVLQILCVFVFVFVYMCECGCAFGCTRVYVVLTAKKLVYFANPICHLISKTTI